MLGGPIRTFGVGLLALAALTVAGVLLRRRRPVLVATGNREHLVDDLYSAGL
ncbi:MAG: hypothetical protein WD934_07210 [Gemmatimonadales bacterium]